MTATPAPSTGLLAVGHQCSTQYCSLVDFLPFKCQHCEQNFCGEHQLPASHSCDKYDELKHNRVAPSCPLCNTPVTIPVGQDPNIRMESHITNECSVMTGRPKKSNQPHCANPRCKKLLFAPIRCGDCNQQFCPQHRFPSDHTCKTQVASSPKPTTTITYTVNAKMQGHASEASAKRNAAMAAIKRSMVSTSSSKVNSPSSALQPVQKSSPSSASSSSKNTLNSMLQTDRSPPLPPANPPTTPAPSRKRTPSTCADDVAKETKSGPTLYAPPSLFASA